jgi:hypothetical protein
MFSASTNIYNKKTKGPTLMELFTATGKLKKFFLQLETFDVCTTGDTAHIDKIFKFLSHSRQHGCIDILHCCYDPCLYVSEVTWQWRDALCTHRTSVFVKKNFFSFPVTVNSSIKVGPLVFLYFFFK